MTTPLGPRGPKDPTLGVVLPFARRPAPSATPTAGEGAPPAPTAGSPAAPPATTPTTASPPATARAEDAGAATFQRGGPPGVAPAVLAPSSPVEGAGTSQVLARLQALGLQGRRRVKTAEVAPRVVDAGDGRVLSGSLTIESRAGLARLEGIARLGGSLTLREGAVKNADLLALRDLKVIEGRLTFEGMRNA
jgi:hypothetical protein